MKRYLMLAILLVTALPLTGCVVAPAPGPGWCYWHPYRCR